MTEPSYVLILALIRQSITMAGTQPKVLLHLDFSITAGR